VTRAAHQLAVLIWYAGGDGLLGPVLVGSGGAGIPIPLCLFLLSRRVFADRRFAIEGDQFGRADGRSFGLLGGRALVGSNLLCPACQMCITRFLYGRAGFDHITWTIGPDTSRRTP